MKQQQLNSRAWLEMLTLGAIWGGVFLAVALALKEIPVFCLVTMRVGFAAVVLWIYILVRKHQIPRGWKVWSAVIVMGILNNAVPFTLLNFGQTQIASGLTSILNAGTVVFATLISAMFLKDERLTPRKLVGVILGMSGVVTVIGVQALQTFDLRSLGQIACIGATFSYALAGVWARKHLSGVSPAASSAGMLTDSAQVMAPITLWIDGWPTWAYSGQTWLSLIYIVIIATVIAYLLYFRVLNSAGASNTLLVTLVVPPIAVTLGAFVLAEQLPLRSLLGFALIATALAVIDGRLWKLAHRTFSTARGSAIPR
ncbi:EamA family transporter [Rhodobacterales bacterium 52_120_T64]|nr:EamA family transporter [Rhodobacterales bacterium 52_120_T64]